MPRSAPEYHQTQAPNATENVMQPAESRRPSSVSISWSFRLRTPKPNAGNAIAMALKVARSHRGWLGKSSDGHAKDASIH